MFAHPCGFRLVAALQLFVLEAVIVVEHTYHICTMIVMTAMICNDWNVKETNAKQHDMLYNLLNL